MGEAQDWRTIEVKGGFLGDENLYASNYIQTARYTRYSLVPKNLFEQFHRSANIWFLIVSFFQLLPLGLSTNASWGTIAPLAALLLATMLKDAYNDRKRHKSDVIFNTKCYQAWNGDCFVPTESQDIRVGQIILLKSKQAAPADCLLLATGHSDHVAHVDNRAIRGDTRLQTRQAIKETQRLINSSNLMEAVNDIQRLDGFIKVEQPNNKLNSFNGSVKLKGFPTAIKIASDRFILSGSTMSHTPWAFGMVVYTGADTKIQQSLTNSSKKVSRIEKLVNWFVLAILGLLLFAVILSTILSETVGQHLHSDPNFFTTFIKFILLYNNIIPISLFIAMDVIRFVQMSFIDKDISMYKEKTQLGAVCKTGDVNDDMGQVEYIFADKNETLSESKFTMEQLYVRDKLYSMSDNEPQDDRRIMAKSNSEVSVYDSDLSVTQLNDDPHDRDRYSSVSSLGPTKLSRDMNSNSPNQAAIRKLFECMTLCNSVIPKESSSSKKQMSYFALSPQEEAMVKSSAEYGYKMSSRTSKRINLNINEEDYSFKIHATLPFKQTYKRSGIVVRNSGQSGGTLYMKGSYKSFNHCFRSRTSQELATGQHKDLMTRGYQVIALMYKELDKHELDDLTLKYENAKSSLVGVDERMEGVFKEYAKRLEFLGTVGIRDEVCHYVGKTVKILNKAGIKVCMVSGDSNHNCLTTAYAANLIHRKCPIAYVTDAKDEANCSKILEQAVSRFIFKGMDNSSGSRSNSVSAPSATSVRSNPNLVMERYETRIPTAPKETHNKNQSFMNIAQNKETTIEEADLDYPFNFSEVSYALCIDGTTLAIALSQLECRRMLVCLIFASRSVIASRLSPMQKAQLVRLVKENMQFRPVTLAVGRCESDLAMIQEADVGIGLMYNEWTQASNSCEVALQQFKDLAPLLLKHGNWNYSRVARVVNIFLYKNFMLACMLFLYIFISDFSGAGLFDSGLLIFYNVIFTTFPLLALGILDQDLTEKEIYKHPYVYGQGIFRKLFNWKKLGVYIATGLLHSLFLYIFVFQSFQDNVLNDDGKTEDVILIGTTLYIATVQTVLFQISLDNYSFSWIYVLVLALTYVLFYLYIVFVSFVPFPTKALQGGITIIFSCVPAILNIFITPFINFLISYGYIACMTIWRPTLVDKIRGFANAQGLETNNFRLRLEQYASSIAAVFRDVGAWESKSEAQSYEINPRNLHFQSEFVEKMFKKDFIEDHIGLIRWVIRILFILTLAWLVLESILVDMEIALVIIRVVILVGFVAIVVYTSYNHYKKNFVWVTLAVMLIVIIAKFFTDVTFAREGGLTASIAPMLMYVLFNVDWMKINYLNGLHLFLMIISVSVYGTANDLESLQIAALVMYYIFIIAAISILCAMIGYWLEHGERMEFVLIRTAETEKEKSQNVLNCLLPQFVRDRVKDGSRFIAEDQGTVTIVFADIVDFDIISAEYSPKELTDWLDEYFQKLDAICEANGITKIETVGKTYLGCAGLKAAEDNLSLELLSLNQVERSVNFAIEIIRLAKSIKLKTGETLKMKIGINTGPVTAGVVGHHKPQFALVGDTVNTASRMGSTLEQYNAMQLSQSAYNLVQGITKCNVTPTQVEAKGKGLLDTYILTEKIETKDFEDSNSEMMDSEDEDSAPKMIHAKTTVGRGTLKPESEEKIRDSKYRILENADEKYKISPFDLTGWGCQESSMQKKYRIKRAEEHYTMLKWGLLVSFITYVLLFIVNLFMLIGVSSYGTIGGVISKVVSIVIMMTLLWAAKKYHDTQCWPLMVGICILATSVISMLNTIQGSELPADLRTTETIYCILLMSIISGLFFKNVIVGNILIFVPWIGIMIIFEDDIVSVLSSALFVIVFILLNIITVYYREKGAALNYMLTKISAKEVQKTEKLLTHMMPPHVYQRLKQDKAETDKLQDVTILYADICGFTNWSSGKTPTDIVGKLSELFKNFDLLCQKYNVYKVHTIGDCYVVLGINNEIEKRDVGEECMNMIKMAFAMLDVIKRVNEEQNMSLNMRLGLHTGEVIAGITGTNIVRYDVYGSDNSMANKMESGGDAGRINISDVTRKIVEQKAPGIYKFEDNKPQLIKAVGLEHMSYFIDFK